MLHRCGLRMSRLALVAALGCSAAAFAGDPAVSVNARADIQVVAEGSVVALEELETMRGGADVSNQALIDGAVTANRAYNLTTGDNTISTGSFAGSNGFNTVIQNSGNNVLIQSSTIINLQLTQ